MSNNFSSTVVTQEQKNLTEALDKALDKAIPSNADGINVEAFDIFLDLFLNNLGKLPII